MSGDLQADLRFLPVGLSVSTRRCVVVGGGNVGERKVRNLLRANAAVTVVAPSATDGIRELAAAGRVRWIERSVRAEDYGAAFLVIAATDDEGLNASIVEAAERQGALACDASSAERSQVIFGALLGVQDATVAVFTDGHDPAAARALRNRIGNLLSAFSRGSTDP